VKFDECVTASFIQVRYTDFFFFLRRLTTEYMTISERRQRVGLPRNLKYHSFFFFISRGETESTWNCDRPQMMDDYDCGAIGLIKIGKGNRSTRREPTPVPLCPPQIPHDLTRARNRAVAVVSRRLTA
jgi:hypothetical protein